mgnify:CR=1 FL=1
MNVEVEVSNPEKLIVTYPKYKEGWKVKAYTDGTLIDEKGIEVTYDILFTFESEETNKNYIAYTDNTLDEEFNKIDEEVDEIEELEEIDNINIVSLY